MKYTRFEDLPVWKAAARFFVGIDTLCDDREVNRRGDLSNQLHRASLSVSNNIAEGFEIGSTTQLVAYLYIAKGSAGEARSMLQTMRGIPRFGHLKSEISNLKSQIEEISKQLSGFAESLQNTPVKGARYLTDAAREQAARCKRQDAFLAEIARINAANHPPAEAD